MPSLGTRTHRHPEGSLIRKARLYDALVGVITFGRERRFREAVLALAGLSAGERVLDVGCGTGTLAIGVKRRVGETGVVYGVDASAEMIALASKKAEARGAAVDFQAAAAQALPFEDSSFDAVLCTMVMHHLPRDQRPQAVAEMGRVLRPGGRLLVVDLAREGGMAARLNPIALLHGTRALDTTREAEALIDRGGFVDTTTGKVPIRNLAFVLARKPAVP